MTASEKDRQLSAVISFVAGPHPKGAPADGDRTYGDIEKQH